MADGSGRAVMASTRQEAAARPQNRQQARLVPSRPVRAAEYTPSSPRRVAVIYKTPMAVLFMPQRAYWS